MMGWMINKGWDWISSQGHWNLLVVQLDHLHRVKFLVWVSKANRAVLKMVMVLLFQTLHTYHLFITNLWYICLFPIILIVLTNHTKTGWFKRRISYFPWFYMLVRRKFCFSWCWLRGPQWPHQMASWCCPPSGISDGTAGQSSLPCSISTWLTWTSDSMAVGWKREHSKKQGKKLQISLRFSLRSYPALLPLGSIGQNTSTESVPI